MFSSYVVFNLYVNERTAKRESFPVIMEHDYFLWPLLFSALNDAVTKYNFATFHHVNYFYITKHDMSRFVHKEPRIIGMSVLSRTTEDPQIRTNKWKNIVTLG